MRTPCFLLCLLLPLFLFGQTEITNLRTEYRNMPLGLETASPRFSWRMETATLRQGARQVSYRIRVSDQRGEQVWDSGKVEADNSLNIAYAGKALQARSHYDWTVTVTDEKGRETSASSWFETALTLDGYSKKAYPEPGETVWNGAQWIGGAAEDIPMYSDYLSVFRIYYNLQIAPGAKSAALVFGANDPRLMDKDKNLFGMANGRDESYVAIQLDVSALDGEGPARLHIYRVGYAADDSEVDPLVSYDIPLEVINKTNRYDRHGFHFSQVYGQGDVYIFGPKPSGVPEKAFGDPAFAAYCGPNQYPHKINQETLNLNPYGRGGDFISAPMLAEAGLRVDPGNAGHLTDFIVTNYRKNTPVIGRLPDVDLTATDQPMMKLSDPSRNAAPMLRTEFVTEAKAIAKARLYITARGIYEVYLNGERVGEDYLNPGLTQYNKTHMYQTYDVTDRLRSGAANALGAWLGEGWWSGAITFTGANWNYFGDRQSLLAQLIITYADGSELVITSNDKDWKLYTEGPIRTGSFFQGEVYDARRENAVAGWTEPDFADRKWKPVVEVPLEGVAETGVRPDFVGRPVSLDYKDWNLRSQLGENARIVKVLRAQTVDEARPGVFVYDMGQNMVGVPRITLENTQAGDTIVLRYAEVRYPELSDYKENENMVMLENIRGALTQDIYVTKGAAREVIMPRFTFHGYRFLEITGIEEQLPVAAVEGKVISSVHQLASSYETSNELVNRFWENITWSLRGNFLSIPTDTPARNERMGWNGDINVFSRAATWLADVNLFLNRHALAIRDMQAENGRFSDVAPVGNGFGGTIWGSAGIVVPWENYRQFGDLEALRQHYPAMQRYVEFLAGSFDNGLLMEGPLGDWLSPENAKNDNTLLWNAYYLHDLSILARTAQLLGKPAEAAGYLDRVEKGRRQFNATYVDPATGKTIGQGISFSFRSGVTRDSSRINKPVDTQASYAIPLAFGLFENQDRAGELLAAAVERTNVDDGGVRRPPYSLMTGFIGTAAISTALSDAGRDDLAYRLLQQETYPSWLYPVKNGATTIWERLNSYTHDEGFGGNNSMNSFNHYSFGAVASWMYETSLGIQRDPAVPGFKHFLLAPTPDATGQMTYAKGHYDSPYGRIESEWEITNGGTIYRFTVPANTSATVALSVKPAARVQTISGNMVPGRRMGGKMIFELTAGRYAFRVE